MGANAKELGLDKLPTEDKVALINELWADVVAEERSHPIPAELAKLLDERVAEHEANPDQLHTIEQIVETLRVDREA